MNTLQILNSLNLLQAKHPSFSINNILATDEACVLNINAEKQLNALKLTSILTINEDNQINYSMPDLVEILRKISQKDLGFGLGYILTTFMAVTNIWVAGSVEQKKQCNKLLSEGKKISISYHELNHGNDFTSNELYAEKVEDGYLLTGKKEVINNISRAGGIVLQARTSDILQNKGAKSHSLFFIDLSQLDENNYEFIERYTTQGAKTCQIGGIEFHQCFISDNTLLGKLGNAFNYGLTAFQITRAVLPGVSLGVIETALKITNKYCHERILYNKEILKIPNIQNLLSKAWLEFSIADNLNYAVLGALHILPKQMCVLASLAKAQIPLRMREVLKHLALILGSRYYIREGEAVLFEKILRDYPIVSLGHSSSFTCQSALIAQMPFIVRKLKPTTHDLEEIIPAIFIQDQLPVFDIQKLRLFTDGSDTLFQSIPYWINLISRLEVSENFTIENKKIILGYLEYLQITSESIIQSDFNPQNISSFDALEKYMWVQCAIATIGRWNFDQTSKFFKDSIYLITSLDFIYSQLNQTEYLPSASIEQYLLQYLDDFNTSN